MSDLSTGVAMSGPQRALPRSAVSRSQQKLAALRDALAQAKRQFREASAREQSIREGTVGRAVLALIDQGLLESSAVALIRDEVRPMLTPGRAAAFIGTVFELPAMQEGSAIDTEETEVAASLAEPDVLSDKRLPRARFGLPPRQTFK